MARIVKLEIKNYRGIRDLELSVTGSLVGLIGRGDSGKTTILDAIHAVLNPAWNPSFYDTDFFRCEPENKISIQATLVEIPEKLLTENRFGLHIRGFDKSKGTISDKINDDHQPALTIQLSVDKTLEPKWEIVSGNEHEEKTISATDRARFNCFKVADYVDSHFSWNKGTPLYSLLRAFETDETSEEASIILEALRSAKQAIDEGGFENLSLATKAIVGKAATLGLDITDASTTIDVRDLSVRDGKVCLHEDKIPFRLMGKGSKRLASMAIQSALSKKGGIMLIDEIEQGLEPDRITNLVRILKDENEGQVFLTTHSRDAICELEAVDLRLLLRDKSEDKIEAYELEFEKDGLKKAVRACPEAFFAEKVIVCEGKTEIGICRALDSYRKDNGKPFMAFADCAYVYGGGSELVSRSTEIKGAGFDVTVLCDSDVEKVNEKKEGLRAKKIKIIDCIDGYSIEMQVFHDLPWEGINDLIDYISKDQYENLKSLEDALKSKYVGNLPDDWKDCDRPETRNALSEISRKSEWFKRIDHGQKLGNVIFGCFDEMEDEVHLKRMFLDLADWIDG